ncbi:hypothetical protein [Neolewinella antarctica]|uniref:Uncharacterized protein n=1 Tax=Neolewinella antarctica TaxID=442734 RepID=A0ABX0X8R6_9BACT|nr:hypothetical protein [Neolewinella antarctica]NJC25334.1 hypothetical protein [Neolewinella antarctica]
MKNFLFSITVLLACCSLDAQTVFNAEYKLPDGIYFSHAAVLAAQPDLGWEAIDGEMVQMPEDFKVQIGSYGYRDGSLDPDLIPYAIGLDGQPYFFLRKNIPRDFYEFSGLRVAGTLSVITYDTTVQVRTLMKAYNPANGQPFREAWVERTKKLPVTKIIDLPSGKRTSLTRPNLLALIGDDKELTKALTDLPDPTPDLLLRAVKLYDDRYPFLIGK